jgi:hypothetical protein
MTTVFGKYGRLAAVATVVVLGPATSAWAALITLDYSQITTQRTNPSGSNLEIDEDTGFTPGAQTSSTSSGNTHITSASVNPFGIELSYAFDALTQRSPDSSFQQDIRFTVDEDATFTYTHTQTSSPYPLGSPSSLIFHYMNIVDVTAGTTLLELVAYDLSPLSGMGMLVAGHEYAMVVTGRRYDGNPFGGLVQTTTTGSSTFTLSQSPVATVPEPSSFGLVASGLMLAVASRRRARRTGRSV